MGKAPRSSRASRVSAVTKKLVGGSTAQAGERSRSLTSEEAYKLLEQRCRGMWSDSDDEETAKEAQQISAAAQSNQEAASHSECSEDGKGSSSTCFFPDSSKAARKKRKGISTTTESCTFADPPPPGNLVAEPGLRAVAQTEHTGGETAAFDVCVRGKHQQPKTSRQQAKGVNRWSAMRSRAAPSYKFEPAASNVGTESSAPPPLPAAGSASRSLKLLKELSGIASSSEGRSDDISIAGTAQGKAHEGRPDQSREDSQKIFDETVHEIRNLVYPHLDRLQRRQFVTTALRALGFAPSKTQKMPLRELLARKKAAAAAVKARQAEEKLMGVRSHIDDKGSVQQAARSRKRLVAQKQRRKHLRDTFKDAGKYTGKRK
ncbi:hypothetical protein Esti_003156 [Eimeria stiedai]